MPRMEDCELRTAARTAYQAGNLKEAVRLQCDLVNGSRRDGKIVPWDLQFLGYLLFNAGDVGQALAAFDQYLAVCPDDVEVLANKAYLLLRTQRPDAAIAVLKEALTLKPDHDKSLAMLGDAHVRLGKLDEARAIGLRVLRLRDAAAA